jgi:hypothetical protein
MSVKNGNIAREMDVWNALKNHKAIPKDIKVKIVLPVAYPDHKENKGKQNRAYLQDIKTNKILVAAPSAYQLVERIENGWKYEPDKKEGLFV